MTRPPQRRAFLTGLFFAGILAAFIVIGSRRLGLVFGLLLGMRNRVSTILVTWTVAALWIH